MTLPFLVTPDFSLTHDQCAQLMLTLIRVKAQDLEADRASQLIEFVEEVRTSSLSEMTSQLVAMASSLYRELKSKSTEFGIVRHPLDTKARGLIQASTVLSAYNTYVRHSFNNYLLYKEQI